MDKWGWCEKGFELTNGDAVVTLVEGSNVLATAGPVVSKGQSGYWEAVVQGSSACLQYRLQIGAVHTSVVKEGEDITTTQRNNSELFLLNLANGSLSGNGKHNADQQGYGIIKPNDRIGVMVKHGTRSSAEDPKSEDLVNVQFFLNGKEFGPGFRSLVILGCTTTKTS